MGSWRGWRENGYGTRRRTRGIESMYTKEKNDFGGVFKGATRCLKVPVTGAGVAGFCGMRNGFFRLCMLLALAMLCVACESMKRRTVRIPVRNEVPENWFRPTDGPGHLMRRVVILPVYNEKYTGLVMKDIDDAFLAELSKLSAFEVVSVSRAGMETIMGRREISSVEPVSVDFFRKMRDVYGAEGVMFVDLTSYSPYRPVSMGVRCKLVDVAAGRIHWASDALYDAGNEQTAMAARAFGMALGKENFPVKEDGGAILLSPKRFARFAAFASFRSLRKDRVGE